MFLPFLVFFHICMLQTPLLNCFTVYSTSAYSTAYQLVNLAYDTAIAGKYSASYQHVVNTIRDSRL